MNTQKFATKIAVIVTVVIAALITISGCFTIVPSGYTGIKTTFGQISEENVPNGFRFTIPFVQQIDLVNNKQQDILIDTQIWGETLETEKVPVYAEDILITYQISPEKSSWLYRNVTDLDRNIINERIVASAVKSAMVEFSANEVTVRSKIEPLTKEKLNASLAEKYGEDTVTVLKVTINNMDFETAYNEAIAAKSLALRNQETKKIENETAIAKAEADKKVSITNAEAKAEATKIEAKAQAEANQILNKSLNENILKSKFYDKWDGKLPTVMGDNSVITDIGNISSSTN